MPQKWSRELILHHISVHHEGGGDFTILRRIRRDYRALYYAARRYFGSLRKAVQASNLSEIKKPKRKSWSKEKIIQEIRRLYAAGVDLSSRYQQKHNRALYKAAWQHFKGWRQAVVAAGVDYDSVSRIPAARKWNRGNIIAEINFRRNKNLSLRAAIVRKEDRGFYDAAAYHFKGYLQALRAAGVSVRIPRRRWTRGRVIGYIKLLDRSKKNLSSSSIRQTHLTLFSKAVKIFGSWGMAVESAGVSYRRHLRRWSTKAWLRRMQPEEYTATLERAQTHAKRQRQRRRK